MKTDDIVKLLSNRINQEHYVKSWLDKIAGTAYNTGFEDGKRYNEN